MEVATISRYETGATLPSLVTLEAVSALLSVPITYLLTGDVLLPDEKEQYLMMLESLSPDDRFTVMNVVTTLVDCLHKKTKNPHTKKKLRVDSHNLGQ